MSPNEIITMRKQQLLVINFSIIIILLISIAIVLMEKPLYYLILPIGILSLIFGVIQLVKRESTKSLVPLLEKIKIYETERLGSERTTYVTTSAIMLLVNGVISSVYGFLLYYWDIAFKFERSFIGIILVIIFFFITIIANIGQHFHNKKVDRINGVDLKGKKSIGIIMVLGLTYVVIIGAFLFYIF